MKTMTTNDQKILKAGKVSDVTRRNFISSCSACAACAALAPMSFISGSYSSASTDRKMNIRVIYSLHAPVQAQPDWPNIGFDFNPVMDNINTVLAKNFPDFQFVATLAKGPEEAEKITALDVQEKIDGYIVYQMNCWNRVVQTIAKTGKPVLYVDFQFAGSGGFLVYNSSFLRNQTTNVGYVASSRIGDLLGAVSCFRLIRDGAAGSDFALAVTKNRINSTKAKGNFSVEKNNITSLTPEETIKRLSKSKILAVRDQKSEKSDPIMGIPLEYIPFWR